MISIHYSNYKSFVDIHAASVIHYCAKRSRKYKTANLNTLVIKHFGAYLTDFKDLVKASPEKLHEIKAYFDSKSQLERDTIKSEFDLITLYDYFVKNGNEYHNTSLNIDYCSAYLASRIEVFVCPYCNENYTYDFNYERASNIIRRTFDWDHVYPKDEYPFFAISFFNLVPSCKVCNQIKLNENEDFFNPHLNVNVDEIYNFELNPVGAGFLSDTRQLKLSILIKKVKRGAQIENNESVVGLVSRYNCHKENIKDIINKKRIYTELMTSVISNQLPYIKQLDPGSFKQTIFGIYFDHKDYYKRAFSKLINDLLKDSKI